MMKSIILVITMSLMVPAYADDLDNSKVLAATNKLGECLKKVATEGRPIPEADKVAFKEALDNFYKETSDYYQLDTKPVKKKGKSPLKVLGDGLANTLGQMRNNGSSFGSGPGLPQQYITPNGTYTVTNMGMGITNVIPPMRPLF
jgi:hypothetical protein